MINRPPDYFLHVVGDVRIFRDNLVEKIVCTVHWIIALNNRRTFHVVLWNIG